jgi:diguanylate cyclase
MAATQDPKQAHRLRRFLLASAFSFVYLAALSLYLLIGRLPPGAYLQAVAIVLFFIVGFYALFRSRWNLRMADASLTAPQLIAAVGTMLYVVAIEPRTQPVFLSFVYVGFMFGMLRLPTYKLIAIAAIALAAFGLILTVHPGSRPIVKLSADDALAWTLLAVTMPWMIVVGGYVRRLRSGLVTAHLRVEDYSEQARRDELTGVYNRRALMAALQQEKRRADRFAQPFALCLIDIDHFKRVNDTLGHLGGDEVLRRLATIVGASVRAVDTFGRYGGEEFLHVLPGTRLPGALQHAERVRELASRMDLDGLPLPGGITVSVGVAEYRNAESIVDTIGRADAALYEAKLAGRNRAVANPPVAIDLSASASA